MNLQGNKNREAKYVRCIPLYAKKKTKKGTETKEKTEFKIRHSRKASMRRCHLNQDLTTVKKTSHNIWRTIFQA